MLFSLPHWDMKIPCTFKFAAAAFNSIIAVPFLKLVISTKFRYNVMKQKLSEGLIKSQLTKLPTSLIETHTFGLPACSLVAIPTDLSLGNNSNRLKLPSWEAEQVLRM